MALTLYLIFYWTPTEINLGISQRIFYVHVPLAWLGMISVLILAFVSGIYLITGQNKWDNLAYAAAELGVVFITLLLISGVLWSKPTWGKWWTWDARLTTTLILWFIYVGYLMVRAYGPKGRQGAKYGAVVALIGAIDTPIIYMATVWWRTQHPDMNIGPFAGDSSLEDPKMQITMLISLLTFTFMYIYLLIECYLLKSSEMVVDEIHQVVD